MASQKPDTGRWATLTPDAQLRWKAEFRERLRYLILDAAVCIVLLSIQATQASGAVSALLLAVAVAVMTVADLVLKWRRLPHRLLTIAIYLCLVALLGSGFFTGVRILWAIIDAVVVFFWAGMYESIRLTIETRLGEDESALGSAG